MDLNLSGKTALVTGSSQGIGFAIAKALHAEGCNIALNGQNEVRLKKSELELGDRVSSHAADLTQPDAARQLIAQVIARWGCLDILVCNIGSGTSVPPGQETPEEWQRVFALNLHTATNSIKAAQSALQFSQGVILCISSICGVESLGAPLTYSTAKAALNHYVVGMARPLAKLGIRINAIAPGNILTDGGTWERKLQENPTKVNQMLQQEVALQRLGQPEEIANFAAFLASPKSSFATGSIFVVDGGQVRG